MALVQVIRSPRSPFIRGLYTPKEGTLAIHANSSYNRRGAASENCSFPSTLFPHFFLPRFIKYFPQQPCSFPHSPFENRIREFLLILWAPEYKSCDIPRGQSEALFLVNLGTVWEEKRRKKGKRNLKELLKSSELCSDVYLCTCMRSGRRPSAADVRLGSLKRVQRTCG